MKKIHIFPPAWNTSKFCLHIVVIIGSTLLANVFSEAFYVWLVLHRAIMITRNDLLQEILAVKTLAARKSSWITVAGMFYDCYNYVESRL